MKNYILFIAAIAALLLLSVAAFAQVDTTIVVPGTDVPSWLSYVVNGILVLISGWLAKAQSRLNKAVPILEGLIKIAEKGTTTNAEINQLIDDAKALVAKEK